jgi:F-type H+-transporting ATPase subunit b
MVSTLLLAATTTTTELQVKARNPILPEGKEILWGAIFFLIVMAVLWKFAFPAIKKALADREARIRDDLERAEASRVEAESSLEEYRRQLAEARAEAGRIIEEARQAADGVRKDLIARAEADAQEIRNRAREDIGLATERALTDLQAQVADLSIDLAERVVERSLDRETQMALIESYINQVSSSS